MFCPLCKRAWIKTKEHHQNTLWKPNTTSTENTNISYLIINRFTYISVLNITFQITYRYTLALTKNFNEKQANWYREELMFSSCFKWINVLAITDAGVPGCALQNTYTFSAKGLLQSDFNRQKSLENFSLPLVTLLKGFELTHNITPPLLHWFNGTQKQCMGHKKKPHLKLVQPPKNIPNIHPRVILLLHKNEAMAFC